MGTEQEIRGRSPGLAHRVVLDEERLTVTGVAEVLRVDPEIIVLRVGGRLLAVRGEALTLKQLTPNDGRVEIRGTTKNFSYEQAPSRGGFLRRLLG